MSLTAAAGRSLAAAAGRPRSPWPSLSLVGFSLLLACWRRLQLSEWHGTPGNHALEFLLGTDDSLWHMYLASLERGSSLTAGSVLRLIQPTPPSGIVLIFVHKDACKVVGGQARSECTWCLGVMLCSRIACRSAVPVDFCTKGGWAISH